MDTIVRDNNGIVLELPTVVKTIKYLVATKPGFYSLADIRNTINAQVEPREMLTSKMVRTAVVKIFARK